MQPTPNEFRVDLKVRNNLLLSAIEKAGFKNVSQFCKAAGLQQTAVGELVNFKTSPMTTTGEFTVTAQRIVDFLNVSPYELWTEDQLHMEIKTNRSSFTASQKDMVLMLARQTGELLEAPEPDEALDKKDLAALVQNALDTLAPAAARVLRMRFGIGTHEHSLEEIGQVMGVTRERARQIEAKAIRLLKRPGISRPLHPYVDGMDLPPDYEAIKEAYDKARKGEQDETP